MSEAIEQALRTPADRAALGLGIETCEALLQVGGRKMKRKALATNVSESAKKLLARGDEHGAELMQLLSHAIEHRLSIDEVVWRREG